MANYFTRFDGKAGLDTERLKEIYDYLSQLQAPWGFINPSVTKAPYDSSQWDSQLVKNPESPAGILPFQNVMENPDYSYIPVGQATHTPQWSENMDELELIDWRRKELEDFWGDERTPEEIDTAMDRFEKKSFGDSGPHEKITPVNMQGETMSLMDLYAQDNPELRLGGNFFPNRGYPQVSLDFLQEYIDSGNIIDYINYEIPDGRGKAAGVYHGKFYDNPYGIGIDPDYTEAGGSNFATEAEILGHEGIHGAVENYHNMLRYAPHPYAYLKAGEKYDKYKRLHQPSTHFSTAHPFHPAMHTIDETFFNAPGQPETKLNRVNAINKAQMENANYIMNYSKQKDNQANLQNWQNWNDMHSDKWGGVGEHKGPVGQKIQTGTTYGPAGMGNPNFNRGGIASLR